MNRNFQNLLCTSCKTIIMTPVWQCKNRHIYCGACLSESCVLCSESLLTPSRNEEIELLIKDHKELCCMYFSSGCDFTGRFIDFIHHQSTCEFADMPLPCVMPGCLQKYRKKSMIEHYFSVHKANNSNPNKVNLIEKGKFQIEVFKPTNNQNEWRNFERLPYVYKRVIGDEERYYLLRVWAEEWVLYVKLYSITHESESVRYLVELPKGKSEESKGKLVMISRTESNKKRPPALEMPIIQTLENFGYVHLRGDVTTLQIQVCLSCRDFYNFN